MDWRRILSALPPDKRSAINLPAALQRFRSEGGGATDQAGFEAWLTERYPAFFESQQTLVAAVPVDSNQVEVSTVWPARFASSSDGAQTAAMRTLFDDARTRISERLRASAPAAAAAAPVNRPDFPYVLLGIAGKGGMGTVHIAKDTELLRRVALKELSAEGDVATSARTRFLREAQITAQLDHPNIVPVYALELVPGGTPAYTMKFVEGKNFHTLLRETRDFYAGSGKPDQEHSLVVRIEHFLKVCDAIHYAHDKGVIHRDLKPANLMLGRHNEVYVMDWGLCRAVQQADEVVDRSLVMSSPDLSGGASDTQAGDVVGTPKYMSPEQAQGKNAELDARSDQCALGLILYELVTLNPPYDGHTAYEVLVNAAAAKRRPVVHAFPKREKIPRELVAVIERATAALPDDRYADVAAFADDLRNYLRGNAVQARPDTSWQRAQRAIAQHRQSVLTGILGLIALVGVVIGGLLWLQQRQLEAQRRHEESLLRLRDTVAAVSDNVQTRMIEIEGAVQNLADSVAQIDSLGKPTETRFYWQREFLDPQSAPPDIAPNERLGGRVSLGWPVWTLPAGMNENEALPTVRKLVALQGFRREIYHRIGVAIRNGTSDIYATDVDDTGDDTKDNPVTAIEIGLSDGIASRYPGWDGLPADYDPRLQPWYSVVRNGRAPIWGDAYRSELTRQPEMALSVPLYDVDNHFRGVVAALLDPDLMVRSLLDVPRLKDAIDVLLIDAKGHVLASLHHTLSTDENDFSHRPRLPLPELDQLQQHRGTGVIETEFRGEHVVLAFDTVAPMGWRIVSITNVTTLAREQVSTPAP
jgi:serine/threonine-protein kinase